MADHVFEKTLTANDTGETGGHQAGMHISKSQPEFIRFMPRLKPDVKNPDAWIVCRDEKGYDWSFRFVYYNNKHHDEGGMRDEYRITHMTKFFRAIGATEGDIFRISGKPGSGEYSVFIRKPPDQEQPATGPIRLRGWRRVY